MQNITKTTYICTLTQVQQNKIKKALIQKIGYNDKEEIQNMLDGRICNMEELISFKEVKNL